MEWPRVAPPILKAKDIMRRGTRMHLKEQMVKVGTAFRTIMSVLQTQRRPWFHQEDLESQRMLSSSTNRTTRWLEVSLKIKYPHPRKAFLRPRMQRANQLCSHREAPWDQGVINFSNPKYFLLWTSTKRVLASTNRFLTRIPRCSHFRVVLKWALVPTFINPQISLPKDMVIWLQLKVTRLKSLRIWIKFTRPAALMATRHSKTHMAKCRF